MSKHNQPDLTKAFAAWWEKDGRNIIPAGCEGSGEYTFRVARRAFSAAWLAAQQEQSNDEQDRAR